MYTINKEYVEKQIIKKSEFICTLIPVNSIDEVNAILTNIRKKYYDATHNCYAYIIGDNAETIKCSDDGEPSQTAGVVILDALQKNNLTNVLAVVTRYFGGIKLGAGGLVRAYSSSVGLVTKNIELLKIEKCNKVTFTVSYANYNLIEKYVSKFQLLDKDFQTDIKLTYLIPASEIPPLKTKLIELTKNQIIIEIKEEISKSFAV